MTARDIDNTPPHTFPRHAFQHEMRPSAARRRRVIRILNPC